MRQSFCRYTILFLENLIHYLVFENDIANCVLFYRMSGNFCPFGQAIGLIGTHLFKLAIELTNFRVFIAAILNPKYNPQRIRPLRGILSILWRFLNAAGTVSTPFLNLAYSLNASVSKNLCCCA